MGDWGGRGGIQVSIAEACQTSYSCFVCCRFLRTNRSRAPFITAGVVFVHLAPTRLVSEGVYSGDVSGLLLSQLRSPTGGDCKLPNHTTRYSRTSCIAFGLQKKA